MRGYNINELPDIDKKKPRPIPENIRKMIGSALATENVDLEDIHKIANEPPPSLEVPKKSGKKGGRPSYEESYTPEVQKIWEAKGGTGGTKEGAKAAYIKAAKRWNVAKYGTDEPSKKASKFTGGSLSRLAEQARPVKVESKGPGIVDFARSQETPKAPQGVETPALSQSRKQERLTRKVEKTQKRITKAGEKGFVAEKGRLESKLGGLQKRQKKLDPTDDASRQSMSKTVASAFSSKPLISKKPSPTDFAADVALTALAASSPKEDPTPGYLTSDLTRKEKRQHKPPKPRSKRDVKKVVRETTYLGSMKSKKSAKKEGRVAGKKAAKEYGLASKVEKTEGRIAATSNKAEKGRLGSKLKYLQKRQTT